MNKDAALNGNENKTKAGFWREMDYVTFNLLTLRNMEHRHLYFTAVLLNHTSPITANQRLLQYANKINGLTGLFVAEVMCKS